MVRCVAHMIRPSSVLHLCERISVHTNTNTARNTHRLQLTTLTKAQCSSALCSSNKRERHIINIPIIIVITAKSQFFLNYFDMNDDLTITVVVMYMFSVLLDVPYSLCFLFWGATCMYNLIRVWMCYAFIYKYMQAKPKSFIMCMWLS